MLLSLACDRCECPGTVDLARQLPPEQPLEPLRDADQRLEVDAGLDPFPGEQVDEILGAMLPVAFGANGQPPIPPTRGVEDGRARLERRVRVREAGVAGVVQMDADRDSELDAVADELRTWRGTPTPTVSAKTISSAPPAGEPAGEIEHVPGSTAPSNGQPNAAPIVDGRANPVGVRPRTIRSAVSTDSSTDAFGLRWLKVSVAAKAKCTSSRPVASRRS